MISGEHLTTVDDFLSKFSQQLSNNYKNIVFVKKRGCSEQGPTIILMFFVKTREWYDRFLCFYRLEA